MTTCKENPDKNYYCKQCDTEVFGRTKYVKHVNVVHKNPGKYLCEYCLIIIKSQPDLLKHTCTLKKSAMTIASKKAAAADK